MDDFFWDMFSKSGKINYYLVYKAIGENEDEYGKDKRVNNKGDLFW